MTVAIFAGLQILLILGIGEFQNFVKFLMIFVEFRSEFTKCWGKFMDFQSSLLSTFYRISNVVHGTGGGGWGWILSGIAHLLA